MKFIKSLKETIKEQNAVNHWKVVRYSGLFHLSETEKLLEEITEDLNNDCNKIEKVTKDGETVTYIEAKNSEIKKRIQRNFNKVLGLPDCALVEDVHNARQHKRLESEPFSKARDS